MSISLSVPSPFAYSREGGPCRARHTLLVERILELEWSALGTDTERNKDLCIRFTERETMDS